MLHAVRRRPTLAAGLLYAVLALLMVAPALIPGRTLSASDYMWSATPWEQLRPADVRPFGANPDLADAAAAFQPFAQYARARLPEAPLWNPHVMGGRPFVGNAQSALFSPFTLPSLVLPFWWSLGIVAALKLWCAAFGTFLLARALGQRAAGALLAGLAFGFSLYLVAWLAWPLASVWALLPWLLLLADACVRRPGIGPVAGLAAVVALQFFGGHPESSFHCLVVTALFALLRARSWRGLAAATAGLAAGGFLAAIALLPFLELLRDSGDLSDRASREAGHVAPKFVLALALPEYWGRPTQSPVEAFLHARAFYVGALPLLLAGLGVALRPTKERVAIAVTGALALAVVLGIEPVFSIVTALPGFAQAANARLAIVVCLCLALLAGWGLDELAAGARPRWLAPYLAAALALPLLVVALRAPVEYGALGDALKVAWLFGTTPAPPAHLAVAPMAAALTWIVLAGASAALIWWRPAGAFVALALALTAFDLFKVGMGQNPAIPVAHAEPPVTSAIRHLQSQGTARFAGLAPAAGIVPLPADMAMRFGLYDARGYDYPVELRYDRLWRRAIAARDPFIPPTTMARSDERALRALGLLGVSRLVQRREDPRLRLPVAYDGPDARIYANPYAQPRAWVVDRARPVGSEEEALDAVLEPGFDPRAAAVVEEPLPGLEAGGGRARITRYEPERVRIEATARGRSLVVLSDVWYPGWRATVDGREAPVERVDYLLRGVAVGPGTHTVELTYRPASWRAGWLISALAAVGLVAAGLLLRRRAGARA